MHRTPAELAGWGHYPVVAGCEIRSELLEETTAGATLSRGMGRSYGDASLPASADSVVSGSVLADRLVSFDPESGVLRAEAGVPLALINRVFLRRSWFTPVTPGTQQVTLGGMVAADVHGKNHHVDGCFGQHVVGLKMRLADGRIVECSDTQEPDLFLATIGGMGLTGHILEVAFRMHRLPTPWIWAESERVAGLESMLDALRRDSAAWPFTVCWIDCLSTGADLGRGILSRGRWAEPHEAPATPPPRKPAIAIPFLLPDWFLNPWQVKLFNSLYYGVHGERVQRGVKHPETFFYPLDAVHHWNRLYGRRGFTQYQCILPADGGYAPHRRLLEMIQVRGAHVYLGVVKDCGPEGRGMISFPRPGVSFALDIPMRGAATQSLVDALNELVISCGGRVYLAKDALTRAADFRKMDPRLEAWSAVRRKWDPQGRLRSAQSVRLLGDPS